MPITTVQIADTTYTLTCPRVRDLAHFEATIGDLAEKIDTVKGRVCLLYLCLKPAHPEITEGVIQTWEWADYNRSWNAAMSIFPFGSSPPAGDSETSTASSPPSTDGDPAKSEPSV